MNRDKLEQEAMRQLQKGNTEKALERYLEVLRIDAKDRRIRQKVAELYLTLGRKPEAVRHFTDVARSLKSGGQERAAVSVYMQLISLRPEDIDAREELADCLEAVGRRQDAQRIWEEAFNLVDRRDARKAIAYARNVARLSPADVPLQVRVAELLEANRQSDEAFDAWVALGTEARRFGRADDQARFLERALALRPDDMDTLLSAAEARIVQGEVRVSLGHLQHAYGMDARNVRLLNLLGRGLQDLGQLEKARKVWLQAARRHTEEGDRDAHVAALRHALECGADDPALRSELERADAEARRHRMRLDERHWAAPDSDDEIAAIVKAKTFRRYGFPARARQALEEAPAAVKTGVPWQIHYAELLASLDDQAGAVKILLAVVPPTTPAEIELADRLEVLGVARPSDLAQAEEELIDEDTHGGIGDADQDELVHDDPTAPPDADQGAVPQDHQEQGDLLAGVGDTDGAIAAYRRALAANPSDTDVLRKIGELMSERRQQEGRAPGSRPAPIQEEAIALELPDMDAPSVDFGSAFGDIDPDALDAIDDAIAEARAMVTIGRFEDALDLLRNQDDAEALVVGALAARGLGRIEGVQTRLERAVQMASEHHPAYVEALWDLSAVYLMRKKAGNAERLMDEISMLDPTWRPVEMAARRRGLELLRQR